MLKRLAHAALLLALAAPSGAALRSTEDVQYWAPAFLHAPRQGPYSALLEVNPRARGDLGRLNQLLLRPWFGYKFGDGGTAHAGYAWVRNDTGRITEEHRAWQQLVLERPAAGLKLSLRPRVEQRWLPSTRGVSLRLRLMARVEKPLGGPWYAALSDEFMHNPASAPGYPLLGPEQNRAYAGIGRSLGGRRRVEAGYQHWWLRRPNAPQTVFHVFVLTTHWAAD